jgi:hypothetical protein
MFQPQMYRKKWAAGKLESLAGKPQGDVPATDVSSKVGSWKAGVAGWKAAG